MHAKPRYWLMKSGLCALTIGAATFLSNPPNAAAAPVAKDKQTHSFHMQVSSGGQLGAQVVSMSDDLRKFFGAPAGVGILVDQVMPDTPAAKAGLKSGDVIVKVAGNAIAGPMEIFKALASSQKGDKVSIEVIRGKKKRSLQAVLDGNAGLGMNWGGASSGKFPFGHADPFGPGNPFKDRFGHGDPFGKDFPFGPSQKHFDFGKDFPFHPGAEAMQEKIRRLEERLNQLEGKKSKRSGKTLKKSTRRSGPKS